MNVYLCGSEGFIFLFVTTIIASIVTSHNINVKDNSYIWAPPSLCDYRAKSANDISENRSTTRLLYVSKSLISARNERRMSIF